MKRATTRWTLFYQFEYSLICLTILLLSYSHLGIKSGCDHSKQNAVLDGIVLLANAQQTVDFPKPKPALILITPQSFKVPTDPSEGHDHVASPHGDQNRTQQYVVVINNAHNDHEDQLIRKQYNKLSLQVRDARPPTSGQLFYEKIFDYFPPQSPSYMLIPVTLEHVSPMRDNGEHFSGSRSYEHRHVHDRTTQQAKRDHSASYVPPSQVIISIRPLHNDSGFGSGDIEFLSSSSIVIENVHSRDGRRSFAVVQTDKPAYKPSEKVRVRALLVNENLRPIIGDDVRIQLKNPQQLIVEEVRFPKTVDQTNGSTTKETTVYLDHEFEFPTEPMLGTWTVQLLHADPMAKDNTSFEVREYELPSFEVVFEPTEYSSSKKTKITGGITARYHYGKPVQGKVNFKYGYRTAPGGVIRFNGRSSIKDIDPNTGKAKFELNKDAFDDKGIDWFPENSCLVVEATVTDTKTGQIAVLQDESFKFFKLPYMFSFEESINDFKAGLTQQLSVKLLKKANFKPAPAGYIIKASYYDQVENPIVPIADKANGLLEVFDKEAMTNSQGEAVFNIGDIRDNITAIRVGLKAYDPSMNPQNFSPSQLERNGTDTDELASGSHILIKHESQNGFISIANKTITHLNVGDRFMSDLLIRNNPIMPHKIYYIILSKGYIVAVNNLDSQGFINFEITEEMMPTIRLIAFAITHDSVGLLSDSTRIQTSQTLECGMKLSYVSKKDPNSPTLDAMPNEEGTIKIKSRQGDIVSLIGVDHAVYSLNNRTRLESSRIIERLKKLDSGCGFGGGRDNLDVFHNAGLVFVKDNFNENQGERLKDKIGSWCRKPANTMKMIEETSSGYSNPMLIIDSVKHKINQFVSKTGSFLFHQRQNPRYKRAVNITQLIRRYKNTPEEACCILGTLDDEPMMRDCEKRSKIVHRYTNDECKRVFFECCRVIYGSPEVRYSNVAHLLPTFMVQSAKIPQGRSSLPTAKQLDDIEAQTLVRKDFRETWLFDIVDVEDPQGNASLDIRLPHSITSWSVSALALNRDKPMCLLSKPLKIKTFQEIFMHLNMPFKIVQGEQLNLAVTLLNYSPDSQNVLLYNYGIEDVCSPTEPGERSELKSIVVDPNSSKTVIFPMIPLKVGLHPVKLVAVTLGAMQNRSDIIERELNVVPRGKPVTDETTFSLDPLNQQRRNKRAIYTTNLVDEIDSAKGMQVSKVLISPTRDPSLIVPKTQECTISAIGDKMGQTVQTAMLDLESLIRLPHGCGEQVMIYLGPTLYTSRYLSAINQLTGDLRWRAIRYIQSGYKRILNFRKTDGSFSAFPRRSSSIWLTAFVTKMLCQTERTPFISNEVHVDKTVITSALRWLISKQNSDSGVWVEENPVYHREMLGGVLKENGLTAFVTISLNECSHHIVTPEPDFLAEITYKPGSTRQIPDEATDLLKLATLKSEKALIKDKYKAFRERNPYVMALLAYSLSHAQPAEAQKIMNDLMTLAERSQSRNHLFWRGEHAIETSAYALQAIIELASFTTSTSNPMNADWMPGDDAIALANWLSSVRSYSGAFESTQDTVVALEALSKFAQLQVTPDGGGLVPLSLNESHNLVCNVSINNRTRRSIEFGKDSSQMLQTFKLDSRELDSTAGTLIEVLTSGTGFGVMSVKLKYNVFDEDDKLCRFNIDAKIKEWQPKLDLSYIEEIEEISENSGQSNAVKSNQAGLSDDLFRNLSRSMMVELNAAPLVTNGLELADQNSNKSNTSQLSNTKQLMLLLSISIDYLHSRRDSGMAVIEIGILSGFKPWQPDLEQLIEDQDYPAKKYEVTPDGSMVVIYMDYIQSSRPYNLQFRLVSHSAVYNLQSSFIHVYEYYSPANSCSSFYSPPSIGHLDKTKCDSYNVVCQCAARSMCPATKKLVNLSELGTVDARSKLKNLICSDKYDLVSSVKLEKISKSTTLGAIRITVRITQDLKGNLTEIMDEQRRENILSMNSVHKSLQASSGTDSSKHLVSETSNFESICLGCLELILDTSCCKNDPLLIHLLQPNQSKRGEVRFMLFARTENLERRYFKVATKSTMTANGRPTSGPKPKPSILSKDRLQWPSAEISKASFDDGQKTQYSLILSLGKESILHDMTYQTKIGPHNAVNELLNWLRVQFKRKEVACQS